MKKAIIPMFFLATGLFAANPWEGNIAGANSTSGTQAPTPAAKPGSGNVEVSQAGTSVDSGTFERTMDKVFDFNSDSINLENGTLNWKGKTFEIGNSRIVRARFERYLSMDLRDQNFETYQKILKEISSMLIASNENISDETLRVAWSKLYDAAEYDVDNDGCITIANTVYQTWRMRNEFARYRVTEIEAQRAFKAAENKSMTVQDNYAKSEYKSRMDQAGVVTEGSKKRHSVIVSNVGKSAIDQSVKGIAKAATDVVAATAVREMTGAKAVLQFQSQSLTFLIERRFQHANISTEFYRHLYKGSAQSFEVGKEQFAKFFPFSNFVPTNDLVESLATEARNDVREGMISVNALFDSGQRYSALMRLMETFALGENEPTVRAFDFEKKKVIYQLYRDLSTLKDYGDNHDLAAIEELVERVRKIADDFPYREIISKVKIGKQSSNLKVMEARASVASGDMDATRNALTEAAKIWPLNPELDNFNDEMMQMTTGVSKYAKRFDELVSKKKFREIMEDAPEYAIALKSDVAKTAKLKEIVGNVSQLDFLIAQAKEFDVQGNSYAAWEMLEKAKQIDAADGVLARAMATLAPKVADYIKLLNAAHLAETRNKPAVALNLYLNAQDIFPTSQSCREGITRVSQDVLKDALILDK